MDSEDLTQVREVISTELLSCKNEIIKAVSKLTRMTTGIKEDAYDQMRSLREELHSAKQMIQERDDKIINLTYRCQRLQEKYDSLHEKYDTIVSNISRYADKSCGSTSKSDVKINI